MKKIKIKVKIKENKKVKQYTEEELAENIKMYNNMSEDCGPQGLRIDGALYIGDGMYLHPDGKFEHDDD